MPAESETDGESPTAMTSGTTSRQGSEPSANASASPETSPPASQSPGTGTETGTETTAATTLESSSATSADTALRTPGHENMPVFGTVPVKGDLAKLEAKVKSMVSTFPGKYGVTFVNLATGERFGVNDTQEYIAASTSKFPMNVLLWKRIAAGEIDPESILVYKKEDFESGTGIIQNEPFGTEYSVRTTSRYSIIHSDNCGINMIIRLLDIVDIRQYLRDLGGVVEYGKTHRSCPADMANVAVDLYRFYYDNPVVAGELIDFLEHTNWNERINGLLPKEVRVAHKIGNQTRTANDVGIVFASEPYVLSVMTDNVDFDAACRNIAKLSKMIYDHMEAQP
jgi:beta-lactamase class A